MARGATTLRPNQRGRWLSLELGTWIVNCPPLPGPGPGNGTKTWKQNEKNRERTGRNSRNIDGSTIRKACGGSSWTSVVTVSRWELAPSHWNAWIEHCKCEKARTQMAHKPSVLLTPTHPSRKQFQQIFQDVSRPDSWIAQLECPVPPEGLGAALTHSMESYRNWATEKSCGAVDFKATKLGFEGSQSCW